ncbi:MAG: 6-carboxytetrahydropterin synthase [Saprospiraceae bacterium]
MRASIYRLAHFNAAHRLHNPKWSDQYNREIFGVCNNANFHGHNYDLEIRLTGEISEDTGYVYDMKMLADLIEEHIEKKLDHKNLNLDVEEFKTLLPSAENIAVVIYNILRAKIDLKYDLHVKLWETPRNYVSYPV